MFIPQDIGGTCIAVLYVVVVLCMRMARGQHLVCLVLLIATCSGCSLLSPPKQSEGGIDAEDGKLTGTVKGPKNQDTPSTIVYVAPDGSKMIISTGTTPQRDYAGESQARIMTWAGIGLVVVGGIGLFLVFSSMPTKLLSWMACVGCIGLGTGLIVLAKVLTMITTGMVIGFIAVTIGIVVVWFWLGGGFNYFQGKTKELRNGNEQLV